MTSWWRKRRQRRVYRKQVRVIRAALAARKRGESGHLFDGAKHDATNELADFIAGLNAAAEGRVVLRDDPRALLRSAAGEVPDLERRNASRSGEAAYRGFSPDFKKGGKR
jgi:hypothetical protein